MMRFMFTTVDTDEDSQEFYHDTIIEKRGMEGATIGEVTELFSRFLLGMGYSESLVNQYVKAEY